MISSSLPSTTSSVIAAVVLALAATAAPRSTKAVEELPPPGFEPCSGSECVARPLRLELELLPGFRGHGGRSSFGNKHTANYTLRLGGDLEVNRQILPQVQSSRVPAATGRDNLLRVRF